MEFRCRVATTTGQILEATYVAESESRLRSELEDKGLFLLSVQRSGGVGLGSVRLRRPRRRRVPTADFLVFNQELATLLKAGLPLVQSLDILRKRVPHPLFKASLDDVHARVRAGSAMSEAFEAQSGLFSGVYAASLMAGEKSGSLEQVLRRYVQHMKMMASARSQLISALIYPVVLLLMASAVVSLIVFKVVPEFAAFYAQEKNGAALPLSTRIVVALSTWLVAHGVILLAGLAALAALTYWWIRVPSNRRRFHGAILRAPWFGPVARSFATAQVSRTLSTLLAGGIPLVNALDVASNAMGNRAMAENLADASKQVREGSSLAGALGKRQMFPHVAIEMVEVGEQTGALSEMLGSVADFYDEQNTTSLTRFSNLVQPVLLVVMGLIIAALLMALYMPLFSLAGA